METSEIKNLPFFFIIGRPRSGTTLLRTILDAHPNVIIPFESLLILNLEKKYTKVRKWTKDRLNAFYKDLFLVRKFDSWPLNKESLRDEILSQQEDVKFQELIRVVYSHFESIFTKDKALIVGDKNPNHSLNIRRIYKLFPDAKFIHLVRDPRDNLASVLKVDFVIPLPSLIAFRWRYSINKIKYLKEKHPESFISVKYEDMVKDPESIVNNICEFLEIPYKDDIINFHRKYNVLNSKFPDLADSLYHKNLLKPINNDSVQKWESSLREGQVKITEMVIGSYMDYEGYVRKFGKSGFMIFISAIPGLFIGYMGRIITYMVNYLPFKIMVKLRNKRSVMANLYKIFKSRK